MATTASALPRWDLTPFFPGIDSPEYAAAVTDLRAGIASLEVMTADLPAGKQPLDATVELHDALTDEANAVYGMAWLLGSYTYGFTSVDSRDEVAAARESELRLLFSRIEMIQSRLTAWLGAQDIDALTGASTVARDHAFSLHLARTEATHLMSQPEEDLAAKLATSGGQAWSKLHEDVSSQITVGFDRSDGTVESLAMTELRTLAMDPDREVRRRAHEAEIDAWRQWETPLAAALNGVKGQHVVLAATRGWPTVLDQALFQNRIDRETLDAMLSAARAAFPDIRRYFRAKARALQVDTLAWYDLSAPIGGDGRPWAWDVAVAFITEQFGTFSPAMESLARRAFDERWIDAEPRPGKTGGAFCMDLRGDESRILANFSPSWPEVATLAHELGHAYHGLAMADRTPIQRGGTPATLAETASTFCETILKQAALRTVGEADQRIILEGTLQDAAQIVVDITSRFLFEQAVFERRSDRELSAGEFCELMLQAQRDTYGDAIAEDTLHPYMWAVKGHYYSMDRAYYNFPYMFGLLFGVGLYAVHERDGAAFVGRYDELLAATGMADAAELAGRFGIDIRSEAFWTGSLDVLRADIDRFEALVG